MSEYIITSNQIEELNRANGGMQIVTSWLSAYAIFDTSEFPPLMKSQHLAITLPNIVRCRDCKYLCDDGSTWGCAWHCSCLSTNDGTPPDDFCSWGEQRTDKGAAIDAAEYQAAINPNTDFDR